MGEMWHEKSLYLLILPFILFVCPQKQYKQLHTTETLQIVNQDAKVKKKKTITLQIL